MDFWAFFFLAIPVFGRPLVRSDYVQMGAKPLLKFYYGYCWLHLGLLVITLLSFPLGGQSYTFAGHGFFFMFGCFLLVLGSAAAAGLYLFFDSWALGSSKSVPIGHRWLAMFSRMSDPKPLTERKIAKETERGVLSGVAAKAETFRTKVDAETMELEARLLRAKAQKEKAERELDEARMTEERLQKAKAKWIRDDD